MTEGKKSLLGSCRDERSHLGKLLAGIALERDAGASPPSGRAIEGAIARRIQEAFSTDHDFSREEISDYLHGERWPEPEFIRSFAEAFSLTVRERRHLAWVYTFSEMPDPRIADRPPPVVD